MPQATYWHLPFSILVALPAGLSPMLLVWLFAVCCLSSTVMIHSPFSLERPISPPLLQSAIRHVAFNSCPACIFAPSGVIKFKTMHMMPIHCELLLLFCPPLLMWQISLSLLWSALPSIEWHSLLLRAEPLLSFYVLSPFLRSPVAFLDPPSHPGALRSHEHHGAGPGPPRPLPSVARAQTEAITTWSPSLQCSDCS